MTQISKMAGTLILAVALAACGGDGGGGTDAGGGDGSAAATLTLTDNAFDPADLTVAAGADLEVSNDGQSLHNLTIEGAGVDEDVEAGQSTTVPIDLEAGEYTMFCEYHRSAGMEGTITVQ
jgi:plastocyanin